jgi:hypothetical protein
LLCWTCLVSVRRLYVSTKADVVGGFSDGDRWRFTEFVEFVELLEFVEFVERDGD